MTNQYKILFLSTPRKNSTAIEEYKAISEVVKNQSVILQAHVDNIDGKKFHDSIFDAHNALVSNQKLIIQYCGDSDIYGFDLPGIEKNEKGQDILRPEKIKNYLSQFPNIIAFLFTSCDSFKLSEKVNELKNIDFAVSYRKKLKDKTSILFSKSFHEKFNATQCFKTAYSYATTQGFLNDADLYNFIPDYKPNPFPYDIKNENLFLKTNDETLDSLIELAVEISQVNKQSIHDKILFNKIDAIRKKIQNIDTSKSTDFSDFDSFDIGKEFNMMQEIHIHKLKKRLVFEYVSIVALTIYKLVQKFTDEKYLFEKFENLIKAIGYNLDIKLIETTEGAYMSEVLRLFDKISKILEENIEINNIDLYVKLHDFISKLTTNDFGIIEKSITNYRKNNSVNIDEITSAINLIKEKHTELKSKFNEPLIPINLTSSWN